LGRNDTAAAENSPASFYGGILAVLDLQRQIAFVGVFSNKQLKVGEVIKDKN